MLVVIFRSWILLNDESSRLLLVRWSEKKDQEGEGEGVGAVDQRSLHAAAAAAAEGVSSQPDRIWIFPKRTNKWRTFSPVTEVFGSIPLERFSLGFAFAWTMWLLHFEGYEKQVAQCVAPSKQTSSCLLHATDSSMSCLRRTREKKGEGLIDSQLLHTGLQRCSPDRTDQSRPRHHQDERASGPRPDQDFRDQRSFFYLFILIKS